MKHKSKLLFIIVAALSIGIMATAQEATDKVVKRDGTTIEAIVSDVSTEEIKFKKANNPTGPTYTLPLKQVNKIILANGEEEVFDAPEDKPKGHDRPIDSTPFGAQKFLVYSEDGQSIITDLIFPDNNRYLCVWNSDLELIKKIQISKRWSSYSQQIAGNGNYLDKSVLYGSDGTELKRFKQKILFVEAELSGLGRPGIVSPTGRRILIHEPSNGKSNREDFYLFDDTGKFIKNYHHHTIESFLFSHKKNMFYIITGHVSKNPTHIEIYDSAGMEVGTVKVGSIKNNVSYFLEDKTIPQFSFDDQYIISKTNNTDVVVADVKGNVIRNLYHPMANAMAFSRDGKKIVTAGNTYFGHTEKIEDEKGNKIEYTGGSIKIWSFEGQLLKEINFPARVDCIQFTPDNDGLVALIGDTGSCVWLSEKDDYKLPDGFEKTVEDMAKYQGEKHDKAIKDKRLVFWVDLTVDMYRAMAVGAAKVQAEKNRLVAQEKKAFKLSQAIANRNNAAKKPSTFTSKSGSKGACHFEFEIIENYTDGKLTGVSISDVYAVPPSHVTKTVSSGKSGEYVEALGAKTSSTSNLYKLFVYPSLMDATKAWQEKGQALEDKYDFMKTVKKAGQCN